MNSLCLFESRAVSADGSQVKTMYPHILLCSFRGRQHKSTEDLCFLVMSEHAFLWRFPVKMYLLESTVSVLTTQINSLMSTHLA